MEYYDIYSDIAKRTNGDIYIGVVGPVRTGKSTFIKQFMDLLVVPNIDNEFLKERTMDELPQSASGKTIMTTEPKFVPSKAANITLDDNINLNVRLIDCVGYIVDEAEGQTEGEFPRMVNTPWSSEPMPFAQAAEIGTNKVIKDHSTIGFVVTTDGSVTGISRQSYIPAEEKVISELKALNKPFVILLNTSKPYAKETEELSLEMSQQYEMPVIPVNCLQLKMSDIDNILRTVLYEFPVKEIEINLPKWVETLESDHWLKKEFIQAIKQNLLPASKLRQLQTSPSEFEENDYIKKAYIDNIDLGKGSAVMELTADDNLFYKILSETTDMPIENDYQLISTIKQLSDIKKDYDKIQFALNDVKRKGYGVVAPSFDEITLDEPEIFKQGSRYGIKLKAHGDTIHMIKAGIETEVSPIVGTEEQSKDFIADILKEYKSDPDKIWNLNIFGRTLDTLVNEGMNNKIYRMPEDAQLKLQETLQKIINEGNGGLICIIL